MNEQWQPRKWSLTGFVFNQCKTIVDQAAADARAAALQRDSDGWWLREYAFAQWAAETLYPQSVARWVATIGDRPESRP